MKTQSEINIRETPPKRRKLGRSDILTNGKKLKNVILARDFNINFLDFERKKNEVKTVLNLMFRYDMIHLTNKPTRIT